MSRVLGRGGTGIVYLARDPLLGRNVAVKVPRLEMVLTTSSRQRFLREAKATALLNHPNIIPIHRVESEAGLVYIVMKYVSGHSLEELKPWVEAVAAMGEADTLFVITNNHFQGKAVANAIQLARALGKEVDVPLPLRAAYPHLFS